MSFQRLFFRLSFLNNNFVQQWNGYSFGTNNLKRMEQWLRGSYEAATRLLHNLLRLRVRFLHGTIVYLAPEPIFKLIRVLVASEIHLIMHLKFPNNVFRNFSKKQENNHTMEHRLIYL